MWSYELEVAMKFPVDGKAFQYVGYKTLYYQDVQRITILIMFRLQMEDHGHGHTRQTTEMLLRINITYLFSVRTKRLF